ncbi:MAG: hypothetical protein JWL76_2012 [Thermoleophilia bacterium]|nr:hypothetical protein [Thermoleophilia bacterium]
MSNNQHNTTASFGPCELCDEPATNITDDYALCDQCQKDGERVPVTDFPCKGCGYVLRFAPIGTGVVQDRSLAGVPGGPYPEFVPGDRTYCLRCITGVEAPQ